MDAVCAGLLRVAAGRRLFPWQQHRRVASGARIVRYLLDEGHASSEADAVVMGEMLVAGGWLRAPGPFVHSALVTYEIVVPAPPSRRRRPARNAAVQPADLVAIRQRYCGSLD